MPSPIRLLPCLLAFLAGPTWAAPATEKDVVKDNVYEIEVLVFSTQLPELVGDELWTRDTVNTQIPGLAEAMQPLPPPAGDAYFRDTAALLEQDGHYRILAHQRWVQTAEAKSASTPVRILGSRSPDPRALDGTIRFYMSRYLHMDVNMLFREYPPQTAAAMAELLTYRLSEQRRIRSQEINYFDHPKFGMLVRVVAITSLR